MKKNAPAWFRQHQTALYFAVIILGFFFYFAQSIHFAQTIPSTVWDESGYIYKGLMFTSGRFTPFEDNGLWTNQMPMAYFLPGISQVLLGAGLRSARFFAVFLGGLTLLGLALAANRARGIQWSALVVWVVALNPGWIKAFSQIFSQGMVSLFFAWTIFFIVGKSHKTWELTAAALLASLAGMTRINVLPLAFFLVLYVFWAHGKKAGLWALIGAAIPVITLHLLYWPDILKIWAYWIPPEIFPPITEFRSPWREIFVPDDFSWWPISSWIHNPQHLAWNGVYALVDALRSNFSAWFGVVLSLFLFPRKAEWKSEHDRKLTIFFIVSFFVLLGFHIWAALGGKSCIFNCLPGYFLFFNWLGIFTVVISASSWKKSIRILPYLIFILLCFATLVAFEYQLQNDFRDTRYTLVTGILRADPEKLQISETKTIDETSPFWSTMREKFGFDRYRWLRFLWLNDFLTTVLWWAIPLTIIFLLPWGACKMLKARQINPGAYRPFSLIFFLVFGVAFAGVPLFAQPMDVATCDDNIIVRQEQVGEQLRATIPAGSQIFWDAKSDIPLLYIPNTLPYYPQINYRFTLTNDNLADPNLLKKFSWWNHPVGETWIEQADYIVTENRFYDDLWNWEDLVQAGEFDIILVTKAIDTCTGSDSELIVLKPIP